MYIRNWAKSATTTFISFNYLFVSLPLFASSFTTQYQKRHQSISSYHPNHHTNHCNTQLKMSDTPSTPSTTTTTNKDDIPTFTSTDAAAAATDFANYFCAYAQLYHQKQMLTDHNRMAAYHAAIVGNADIFKDKIVMDVGTGSGILAGEYLLCVRIVCV